MKKPKTMEDFRAYALACLDIASNLYVKIRANDGKALSEDLSREFIGYVGMSCRHWIRFRDMLAEHAASEFSPLQSPFIGSVKTAKWPESENAHIVDKVHVGRFSQWELVKPGVKMGKPIDPKPGTINAVGCKVVRRKVKKLKAK